VEALGISWFLRKKRAVAFEGFQATKLFEQLFSALFD
jgi:hypothetical protein